jgi:hypothetical protein
MGVWDMLYLTQKYRKALEQSDNPAYSPERRAEFTAKAEHLRAQMARFIQRVEKQQQVQELLKAREVDLVTRMEGEIKPFLQQK